MDDVPADLIMNWGINIVPSCPWTMEEKGAKRVDCVGIDDKRQITVVICATINGIFLPFQPFTKVKPQLVCLGIPSLKTGL